MLYSLKTITKETMRMASCFKGPTPDPRLSPEVELGRGYSCRLFNLISSGKTLACEGIAAEKAPPALPEIQPTGPFGNEYLLDATLILLKTVSLDNNVQESAFSNELKAKSFFLLSLGNKYQLSSIHLSYNTAKRMTFHCSRSEGPYVAQEAFRNLGI